MKYHRYTIVWLLGILLGLLGLSGCSSVPAQQDSFEPLNRRVDRFNDRLDRAVMKPVAHAYLRVTSKPIRLAISNVFANAGYPAVIVNDWLQGKGQQGVQDMTRLVLNSTVGVLGLFDVASGVGLPAHDEDFGQTLGVWGLRRDAYIVVPFVGPNTVLNLPNFAVAGALNGLSYITDSGLSLPLMALKIIDKRAQLDDLTRLRDTASLDAYSFTRDSYLQRRQFLLYDGNPPLEADFE